MQVLKLVVIGYALGFAAFELFAVPPIMMGVEILEQVSDVLQLVASSL